MKKLLLFIFFPLFSFAQTDSVKVSFSEEKVDAFARTEVINFADRIGPNRKANAALKFGAALSTNILRSTQTELFAAYEQKFYNNFSMNIALNFKGNYKPFIVEISPRWYFDMQKRVSQGLQASNFYGRYLGIKYKNRRLKNSTDLDVSTLPYREASMVSLDFGKQFGNTLDISVSAGFKNVREAFLDSRGVLVNDALSPKNSTWFIASNFRIGFGDFFPKIPKHPSQKFEKLNFSNNNFDTNKLLKINSVNVISVDKYSQFLKVDIAYERRIKDSPFSLNSTFVGQFNHFLYFRQKGNIDTTYVYSEGNNYKTTIPTWQPTRINNFYTSIELSQQLRYYLNKNREIRKGKSGRNFNGPYTGIEANFTFSNIENTAINNEYFTKKLSLGSKYGLGLILGVQNQFKSNIFFDWGVSFLVTNKNAQLYSTTTTYGNKFSINPYLKIGFVK